LSGRPDDLSASSPSGFADSKCPLTSITALVDIVRA
jgi:hypothetical protein